MKLKNYMINFLFLSFSLNVMGQSNAIKSYSFDEADLSAHIINSKLNNGLMLEAFKCKENVQIIAKNETLKFKHLAWVSPGLGKLLTLIDWKSLSGLLNGTGYLNVNVELLTSEHRNLLVKKVYEKYSIKVTPGQIAPMALSKFECSLESTSPALKFVAHGRVKDLKKLPFTIEFKMRKSSDDKESIDETSLKRLAMSEYLFIKCEIASVNYTNYVYYKKFTISVNENELVLTDLDGLYNNIQSINYKINRHSPTLVASTSNDYVTFIEHTKTELKNVNHFLETLSKQTKQIEEEKENYPITLTGHTGGVTSLILYADRYLISGSLDKTIRIWNSSNFQLLNTLSNHTDCVRFLLLFNVSYLASASDDTTIKIWNLNTNKVTVTLYGHSSSVRSLVQTKHGNIISGSWDTTIKIWNLFNGKLIKTLRGHSDYVMSLVLSPNGFLISGSADETIKIWNVTSGQVKRNLTGHYDWVRSLLLINNTYLASGSDDRSIRIWNIQTGEMVRVLNGHAGSINSLLLLNSNHHLASATDDETIKIWNLSNGELVATLSGHESSVKSLVLLKNGHLVSGSSDSKIKIWKKILV